MQVFETLNGVNVNGHTEKKKTGNAELTYLSWPWAWSEVKSRYPDAHYEVWKNPQTGLPYTYDHLTGYMVYTSVTIDGITHEMWLPVMDGANKAMKDAPYEYSVKNPLFKYAKYSEERGAYIDKYGNEQPEFFIKSCEAATMFDVNKTIMRCLVKNLAMFGLGLYIFAGEDLPEGEKDAEPPKVEKPSPESFARARAKYPPCADCGKNIERVTKKDGEVWTPEDIAAYSNKRFGRALCPDCQKKALKNE